MADNYINPIDEKMVGYANRMRDLILEAYAEGIVLTAAPHPEEQCGVLSENQRMRRMVAAVNETDHSHPLLRIPHEVSAKAVIEISQSIVSSKKFYIPKSWRVYPVFTSTSEGYFVDSGSVNPWIVGQGEYHTSALKFGRKMDFLALTYFPQHAEQGKIHELDVIDVEVSLDKIFYRLYDADGVVREMRVGGLPGTLFFTKNEGNYQELYVDYEFVVPNYNATIRIEGSINRHFGTLELRATSKHLDVGPLGFTLNASRIKPRKQG